MIYVEIEIFSIGAYKTRCLRAGRLSCETVITADGNQYAVLGTSCKQKAENCVDASNTQNKALNNVLYVVALSYNDEKRHPLVIVSPILSDLLHIRLGGEGSVAKALNRGSLVW